MGFYSPDQILQDARRHWLQTLPVDVTCSDCDCSLEAVAYSPQPAIQMGLRMVRGLAEEARRWATWGTQPLSWLRPPRK